MTARRLASIAAHVLAWFCLVVFGGPVLLAVADKVFHFLPRVVVP